MRLAIVAHRRSVQVVDRMPQMILAGLTAARLVRRDAVAFGSSPKDGSDRGEETGREAIGVGHHSLSFSTSFGSSISLGGGGLSGAAPTGIRRDAGVSGGPEYAEVGTPGGLDTAAACACFFRSS